MFETGERVLVHREAGYDFLIDSGWLCSVPRVVVKRGTTEAVVYLIEDEVHFYDDLSPFDESESETVLRLVEENLDDMLSDFWEMRNDWKRDRLLERWGVDGRSVDELLEKVCRSYLADLE